MFRRSIRSQDVKVSSSTNLERPGWVRMVLLLEVIEPELLHGEVEEGREEEGGGAQHQRVPETRHNIIR